MTEANTEEYSTRAVGRPPLGERGTTSPQIAFRIPVDLRERAARVAEAEGITVSALAREALEKYVASR